MRHFYDTAARFTGVLLIIPISRSVGFVRGARDRASEEAGCAATVDGKAAWLRGR